MSQIHKIVAQFQIQHAVYEILPFGNGHIHDTYKVLTKPEETPNFLLQRINTQVFPRVTQMMNNIHRVTKHQREALEKKAVEELSQQVMQVIPTVSGKYFFKEENAYWRVFSFVEEAMSYETPPNEDFAREAGRSLGKFQSLLMDFPAETLFETIPHFHNVKRRVRKFNKVLKDDPVGRVSSAEQQVQFAKGRRREMSLISELLGENLLPIRVTHNDTKFNNLLFDAQGNALMWIDLDTVMPGCVHFDFGDAIRVLANSGDEDEEDLNLIEFNFDYFKAFAEGYLKEIGHILAPMELIHLAFSAKMMTFIMGLRFLTDYLEGDPYYKTSYAGHNLVRAKSQFKLLSCMDEVYDEMKEFIEHCFFHLI